MDTFKHSYKTVSHDQLMLHVLNAGFQKCEPGYHVGPVAHDRYIIHHIAIGKGRYVVKDQAFSLQRGDTFVIFPDTVVEYQADPCEPWQYNWVGFQGAMAKTLVSQTGMTPQNPVMGQGDSETIRQLLYQIYSSRGETLSNQAAMTGYLYLLMAQLIGASLQPVNEDISMMYLKRATEFIAKYYTKPITVEEIARHLNISRSHLYRIFVKHMDISPKAYLDQYKIHMACVLMVQTSLSLQQIAAAVGYDDPFHFSKVFKREKNCSPAQYRQQYFADS